MKPLIQSTVWCPDHQGRIKDVMLHLNALQTYNGDYDLLLVDNGSCEPIITKLRELEALPNCTVQFNGTNIGWAKARNRGIVKTLEENYSHLIMMDCDIVVENKDWLAKVEKAFDAFPTFMCRHSKQPGWITKIAQNGIVFDLWDEWLGCINVAKPEVLKRVGGYDWKTFPADWGFHDTYFGRFVLKAGFLGSLTCFPSLSGLGVVENHDKTYDNDYQPWKNQLAGQYAGLFWEMAAKVMNGSIPPYFNPYDE